MIIKHNSFSDLTAHVPNANDDWLIGKGFLSRGGSVLICGEPGAGKSKLSQHWSLNVALGRPFLGLTPTRALKVLYVQAEDTVDDLHDSMVGFHEQHGLLKADRAILDQNWACVTAHGLAGEEFVGFLKREIEVFKPDVVITDPLLAFVGCDLTNQDGVTEFLRRGIGPMLMEQKCGWICVHHASKGASGKFGGSKVSKSLGTVEISAFFRGVIDLERKKGDPDALVMEIAKRNRQAGLRDAEGKPVRKQEIRMGEESVSWALNVPVVRAADVPAKMSGRPAKIAKTDVKTFAAAQKDGGKSKTEVVKAVAAKFGYSLKQARRLAA